jgi:pimeloyl-ACP methyl ester carboxylesterase
MELCDFIVPGTGVVDSLRFGPLRISVAPWAYRKLSKLTDEAQICSMRWAGLGDCDVTMRRLIRKLEAYVALHGPANVIGHSQGAFQLLRIYLLHPELFGEVILIDGPLHGSTLARFGSRIAAGFGGMTPESPAVIELGKLIAGATDAQLSRVHCYATSNGVFVLPHVSALIDHPSVDNVWVGPGFALNVRGYARWLRTPKRVGHLDVIWTQEVLDDILMIFEAAMWPNVRSIIPKQRKTAPIRLRASS